MEYLPKEIKEINKKKILTANTGKGHCHPARFMRITAVVPEYIQRNGVK